MDSAPLLMVIGSSNMPVTAALARAAAIAHKSGASLLLARFDFDPAVARGARGSADFDTYQRTLHTQLETLAAPLRSDGLAVTTRVYWGRPILAHMLRAVLAEQPQMVFKQAQREPALKRLLFTPEDLDLLRQCPAPLMLVRGGPWALPRRILAAVDPLDEHGRPHELNARVLDTARQLASQCGAELDVVHAFEYLPRVLDPALLAWSPGIGPAGKSRREHHAALLALGRTHGVAEAHLQLLDGLPVQSIARYAAQHQHDLVVMGTVQRNFLQRLALGSVAEGLLQQLECDVLALKPAGFADSLKADLERGRLATA